MTAGPGGAVRRGGSEGLWAITSYFNPVGDRRRRDNFRIFRERLSVPLVAVELGFDGRFDLRDGDADILVRLDDGGVMFQKERLLNLARAHLPPECRHVAWLDGDILFESDDWSERAVAALERHSLVHLFDQVDYMPPGWAGASFEPSEVHHSRRSLGAAVAGGENAVLALDRRIAGTHVAIYCKGFAWAARREVLDRVGFYDECIVGGGDSALAAAALGDVGYAVRRQGMSPGQENSYRDWARAFGEALDHGVGAVAGRIFHLWHGGLDSRMYGTRHVGMRRFGYEPAVDLALSESGAWRWNSSKPEMHDYVASYFAARKEDA
ncbi:MAG: hypothetical protein KDK07_04300 [Bauldia sp.]|nr:hypothetical protein [Bauldia sp.]